MNGIGQEGRRGPSGRGWKVLGLGIVMLGFSLGLFAQAKCLYYEGALWEWDVLQGGGVDCTAYTWDGANLTEGFSDAWGPGAQVLGSPGACVFNGKIYCFCVTADSGGTLWYLTVDPDNGNAEAGPTKIATGLGASATQNGAAAAVCHDAIYVFTPGSKGFTSKDGKSFTTWNYTVGTNEPQWILDAVPLYPASDNPASIMLVYKDAGGALRASIFSPTALASVNDFLLPWPSANPYLWEPVGQGNLVLGTSAGFNNFSAGATAPCIQFYGLTALGQDGIHEGRWEYNVAEETWTFNDITVANTVVLEAWPWFETVDTTKDTMRLSHILSYWTGQDRRNFVNPSDWMIPQNDDTSPGGYGWAGTPTPTSGAVNGSALQGLWTLVGVVLGPPPFGMNGASDACPSGVGFSWVDYGKDTSTTVTTTSTSSSTVSVAMNNSIKAGIGEFSLDLSYAHAWTSSHGNSQTVSVSQDFQFGPCSESVGSQGTHGWAIFNAPTLVTQWYKLYAYDESTYLNEDIYATALGDTVQQFTYFELADPSQGGYPGLLAGMPAYPDSTDVGSWNNSVPDWNNGGSDWTVTFGDKTDPQMPVLSEGGQDEASYTQSNTTISSNGNSNSFGVQAGAGVHFMGFSTGVTVGYDGEWTNNTENESTITQSVTCALNMQAPPSPCPSGDVCDLVVQPYWLQAKTTNAPWIPTGYGGDVPWCITWHVTGTTAAGRTMGLAAAPASASGTIRHGGDNEKDSFTLSGGHMAWLNADGSETPVPMTADQFAASMGASVSLNGHAFSADGSKGKWSRSGDAWTYKTRKNAKGDHFTLSLDFANKIWSFDGSSRKLDQEVLASDASVRVHLALLGQYTFTLWLKHDVHATWSDEEKKASWPPYGVHKIKGDYDSPTGLGHIELKGHIPKNISAFGDIEIRVNGVSVSIPLLSVSGFLDALDRGRSVKYSADGLSLDMDFGTGKWTANFEGGQFQSGMAPKGGAVRVQILLGGTQISDQTVVLQKCTTGLRFAG